jgi:hypothetical protein
MRVKQRKPRFITQEVCHGRIKAGDRIMVSYGVVTVVDVKTREDGWVEYRLEGQQPIAYHPSCDVTLVIGENKL